MSIADPTPDSSFFVLLRHGESTGNAENRHQGQADFPLTAAGLQQVEKLLAVWQKKGRKFSRLISSPLDRARQTAEILAGGLQLKVEYNPIWMERDNGKLAGLLHETALEEVPRPDFIPRFQPIAETGESQWELYLRAGQALNKMMKYPPGEYLIVSHGGFLNMVMHAVVGLTPQPNFQGPNFRFFNTGYTSLLYKPENENIIILGHNQTSHLD